MVSSGLADVALVSQPDVLMARNAEMPVVSIAAVIRQPMRYLVMPKSSPVHYPRNLEGARVGYARQALGEAIVRTMLDDDDADQQLVSFANVGWSYADAFQKSEVSAIVGPTLYHDRLKLEEDGIEVREIEPMLYGVPIYYETVVAADETKVTENPGYYISLWEAMAEGQAYVQTHPNDAVRLVLNRQVGYAPISWDIAAESLKFLLPFMNAGDEPFGYQEEDVWSDAASWLTDVEAIDASLDSESAYLHLEDLVPEE